MLEAELSNGWADFIEGKDPLLEHVLQKDDDDAHLSTFLLIRAEVAALVHAPLDEKKDEFDRQVHVLLDT